ncbi:MAG: formate/nitrite transporter family protein [Methanospirillum sp.]|nr:formate/nitrite transporter family protein [Methanospirillum sp.]
MSLPSWNILLRGGMAGAYIGMGTALMVVVSTGVADMLGDGMARLLMGVTFPLGVILAVMTGAELFTGDAMLAPFAAFRHNSGWTGIIRVWILSYLGNLIGAAGFACLMVYGVLLQSDPSGVLTAGPYAVSTVALASEHCRYAGIWGLFSCFIKAVSAGWLLNLAILLGICADDAFGKIVGIWFPAMTMTASGFEYSITNAYLVPAGLIAAESLSPLQVATIGPQVGSLGWSSFFLWNLIPSTVGNLAGGLIFAGLLLWIAFKKELS